MAQVSLDLHVDLVGVSEVLHEHLTGSLVKAAFEELRDGERQRVWTLERMVEFWTAVVLRAPPSLCAALREASGGGAGYPHVESSNQAFFQRCENLRWEFFAEVRQAFGASVKASEPPRFAQHQRRIADDFQAIYIFDGSDLDPVARRLKITQGHTAVPLPGVIFACYDLRRGTLEHLGYSHTLTKGELVSAREVLQKLPPGSLVLGDRLYGTPSFLSEAHELGLSGVFRRPNNGKVELREEIGRFEYRGGILEDSLITLGARAQMPARLVRLTIGQKTHEFVTNVLDPERLSAVEIADLYDDRWDVERMFYDLKEVLNLGCFYCGNANAVAMQLYAAAIVYTAMRTAQGRIAAEASIEPEALSPAKLFPLLGAASATLTTLEYAFLMTQLANPGVTLKKPDWRGACCLQIALKRILADKTRGTRPRTTTKKFEWGVRWRELPPPRGARKRRR